VVAVASRIALLLVAAVLVSCATPGRPPVADRSPVFTARPSHYMVRAGDTLYSIAWRYQLDVVGLARANGLRAPYTIHEDQRIQLRLSRAEVARKSTTSPARQQPSSKVALQWAWPVSAPVTRPFSTTNKGVDFRVRAGDRVRAAAAGEVVYAGNGLGGYEHLVIVKHSQRYLSAYSLNTQSRVREGQKIKAGADLADIPLRGRDARTLHFEIRKEGEAVNPRSLIGH
jgi:lipoprotein NlpD